MSEKYEGGIVPAASESITSFDKDLMTKVEGIAKLVEMLPALAEDDLFRARDLMKQFGHHPPFGTFEFNPEVTPEMQNSLRKIGIAIEDELQRRGLVRRAL